MSERAGGQQRSRAAGLPVCACVRVRWQARVTWCAERSCAAGVHPMRVCPGEWLCARLHALEARACPAVSKPTARHGAQQSTAYNLLPPWPLPPLHAHSQAPTPPGGLACTYRVPHACMPARPPAWDARAHTGSRRKSRAQTVPRRRCSASRPSLGASCGTWTSSTRCAPRGHVCGRMHGCSAYVNMHLPCR